jgi:D-glycero-alpha-D-manno-heptose-7-phosphate kinase
MRKALRSAMENAGLKYMDFKFDFEGVKVLGNF